jgi:membrane-bound serine protease (ClpP class)
MIRPDRRRTLVPRRRIPVHLAPAVFVLAGLLGLVAGTVRGQEAAPVVVLPTSGVVDQIMAGYIRDGIAKAEADGAQAVIIQLDTPGGSLDATREIVQAELDASIPVIVWVGPAGARAASAGTFITLASHVAAMAPATNIGAATPIGGQGEDIQGDLGRKVLNDTVKQITSIAEMRGRPVDWAVAAVEQARSYTVDEALAAGAIDVKASDVEDLLAQADGMTVQMAAGPVTLHTAGAPIADVPMNPFQQFLHLLADPNLAFILLTLGFYGIYFELQNPNWVTGILGAFALILAFLGLGNLPLNIAGLLLIGLGVLLFVLEITVTSHGLLTVAGLIAFALGASALYTPPGDPVAPAVTVDMRVVAVMTFLTALVMIGIFWAVMRTRRMPQYVIGRDGLSASPVAIGTEASVRRTLAPVGTVYAVGEEWSARTVDATTLERGTLVRVVSHENMTLIVARAAVAQPGAGLAPPLGGRSAIGGDRFGSERTA